MNTTVPDSELYIINTPEERNLHYSPRVGLKFRQQTATERKYIMAHYRATTVPTLLKKQSVTVKLSDGKPVINEIPVDADLTVYNKKPWTVGDLTAIYKLSNQSQ